MPRDGSGVYTLPSGNPVVTNTVIASAWANSTMSDIAAQLNNVFTRDGTLGPTGPFKLMDGTVAAPGLAFNSEPGLGWYRVNAGVIGMAAGGAQTFAFNAGSTDASYLVIGPRAAGAGHLQMWSQASTNRANDDYFLLTKDATATRFRSLATGTGTTKPFFFSGAPSYNFDKGINISSGAISATLSLDKGVVGAENAVNAYLAGVAQFRLILGDGTAAGNLHWQRFDNAGAYLGTFMHVDRLSGLMSLNDPGGVYVNSNFSVGGAVRAGGYYLTGDATSITQDANYVYSQMAPSWYWLYTKATGRLEWYRAGQPTTTFNNNGDFYAGNNIYQGTGTNFGLVADSAVRYIRFAGPDNYRLLWEIASGQLYYASDSLGILFSCNTAGVFTVKNQLITGAGGVNSGGAVLSSAQNGPSMFWDGGGYNIVRFQNGGAASAAWSIGWERSGGTFHFFGASTNDLFTINGAGDIRATGVVTCGGNMRADGGTYYMLSNNSANINHLGYTTSNYATNGAILYNNLLNSNPQFGFTLTAQHTPGVVAQYQMHEGGVAFSFRSDSVAHKTSGDPTWAVGSDVRLKHNIVDSSVGLAEIMSLRVRQYEFIPHPELYDVSAETREAYPDFDYGPQGTFIGIVADEAEAGFPHIIKRGPGKVGADDVEDLATLHAGPVIWALVNAIKTLNERLTALEAA